MPLYKTKRSPFFFYDIRVAGKRYRGSTKQKSITLARQYEAVLLNQLNSGEASDLRTKSPKLSEFATRFFQHVGESRLEEDSKEYYRTGWKILSQERVAHMRMDTITTSTGDAIRPKGSGSRINCALRTLKRMLSLAGEWNVIQRVPTIHLAKEAKRERLIRPEEEIILLAKANDTCRDVLTMVLDMGVRPSEAVAIQSDNVDFATGLVLIASGKTHNARRWVSMTTRVRQIMVTRIAKGGKWIFPSSRRAGHHILAGSVVVMFSQLKRDLGFPDELVLYSARHTFATDMQSMVRDISKTSKQLGHGSLAITQRYVHPETSDLSDMMDQRNVDRHTFWPH